MAKAGQIVGANQEEVTKLIEAARRKWGDQGMDGKPAASAVEIDEFERPYNVRVPGDLRRYFTELDGMDDLEFEDESFSFLPLKAVKPSPKSLQKMAAFRTTGRSFALCRTPGTGTSLSTSLARHRWTQPGSRQRWILTQSSALAVAGISTKSPAR